jgi:hypothetical protein
MLTVFRTAVNEEGKENRYKVWQEGYHPIAIDSADFFLEKLNYLYENSVRKGFIEQSEQWRYFPYPFLPLISGIPYSGTIAWNYLIVDHSVIQVGYPE